MLLVASLSSVLFAFCFLSFNVQVNSWKTPYRTLRRPSLLSVQQKDAEPAPITSSKQYLNKGDRPYLIGSRPESAVWLGALNFRKEISQIFVQIGNTILQSEQSKRQSFPDLLGLRLSNEAVKQAERDRIAAGGRVDAHPISQKLYDIGCSLLDNLFDEKPIERFWFLETVARIPYFVYVSMLHLYESLGWWREPSLRKIHNAEEWNELHHLLILETMGGDKRWSTRFFGFHAAIVYYWLLIATYLYSPRIAYQFMELLEAHAVDTYGTFVAENAERLKQLPAPDIAVTYYKGSDLYTFDDFQVRMLQQYFEFSHTPTTYMPHYRWIDLLERDDHHAITCMTSSAIFVTMKWNT